MGNILSICCPQYRHRRPYDGKNEPLLPESGEQPTYAPAVEEPPSLRQGTPPINATLPSLVGGSEGAGRPTSAAASEPTFAPPCETESKVVPKLLQASPASSIPTSDTVPIISESTEPVIGAAAMAVAARVDVPVPGAEPMTVATVAPIVAAVEHVAHDAMRVHAPMSLRPPATLMAQPARGVGDIGTDAAAQGSWSPRRHLGPPRRSTSPQHPALVFVTNAAKPASPALTATSPQEPDSMVLSIEPSIPAVLAATNLIHKVAEEGGKASEEAPTSLALEAAKDSVQASPMRPPTPPAQAGVVESSPTADLGVIDVAICVDVIATETSSTAGTMDLELGVVPLPESAPVPSVAMLEDAVGHEVLVSSVAPEFVEVAARGATTLIGASDAPVGADQAVDNDATPEAAPAPTEMTALDDDGFEDGLEEELLPATSAPSSSIPSASGAGKKSKGRGSKNKKKKKK